MINIYLSLIVIHRFLKRYGLLILKHKMSRNTVQIPLVSSSDPLKEIFHLKINTNIKFLLKHSVVVCWEEERPSGS